MQHKKVVKNVVEIEVVKTVKFYLYKIPSRNYLTPIPYEISTAEKTELIKLIKFCKDANNSN